MIVPIASQGFLGEGEGVQGESILPPLKKVFPPKNGKRQPSLSDSIEFAGIRMSKKRWAK